MKTWWRNQPMEAEALPLKGAQRIVFEELERMLAARQAASIFSISERTGYCTYTVCKALQQLRTLGLIEMDQPRIGMRAEYRIIRKTNT
jgi:hypothetical protein